MSARNPTFNSLPKALRDKIIAQGGGPPAKRSKYGNMITTVDGIKFRSIKEAKRYQELKVAREAGELWFLRQVPFYLPGNTKYVLDFMVFWSDGAIVYEDVKGMRTPAYRKSKKQVEALYPVKITEI